MKKFLILMFTLVMVLSLSSCGKIAEKVKEKAKDGIEKKLDEAGVDTDKLEEEVDKLKDELVDDESKDKEEKKEESKDDKDNENKPDISLLDKTLSGIALIKACEPFFKNDPMSGEGSFYSYSKLYSTDDEQFNGDYTVKMYLSEGRKNKRIEILTDSEETTTTMITNGEKGKIYMIFGNGKGYKIPSFGMEDSEDDDMGFDFTLDDEAIKYLKENLIEAKIEELNGEMVLYIKERGEVYEVDNIWLSLERSIMLKYEAYNGDTLVFSSELLEFESGGDYSEMFEEPEGVDWMSMEDIGKMFTEE